jgi:hypothetical protein
MIKGIFCIVLLIIAIGLLVELDRRDAELDIANKINSGLAEAIDARDLELQSAYNEAQCYKDEVSRLRIAYTEPDGLYLSHRGDLCDYWDNKCNTSEFFKAPIFGERLDQYRNHVFPIGVLMPNDVVWDTLSMDTIWVEIEFEDAGYVPEGVLGFGGE